MSSEKPNHLKLEMEQNLGLLRVEKGEKLNKSSQTWGVEPVTDIAHVTLFHEPTLQSLLKNLPVANTILKYLDRPSVNAYRLVCSEFDDQGSHHLEFNYRCGVVCPRDVQITTDESHETFGNKVFQLFDNARKIWFHRLDIDVECLRESARYVHVFENFGDQLSAVNVTLEDESSKRMDGLKYLRNIIVDWCPNLKQLLIRFAPLKIPQADISLHIPAIVSLKLQEVTLFYACDEDDQNNREKDFGPILASIMGASPALKAINLLGRWPRNTVKMIMVMGRNVTICNKLKMVTVKSYPRCTAKEVNEANLPCPVRALCHVPFKDLSRLCLTSVLSVQVRGIEKVLELNSSSLQTVVIACDLGQPEDLTVETRPIHLPAMKNLEKLVFLADLMFPLTTLDFVLGMPKLSSLQISAESTLFYSDPERLDWIDVVVANSVGLEKKSHGNIKRLHLFGELEDPGVTVKGIGKIFPNLKDFAVGLKTDQYDVGLYLKDALTELSEFQHLENLHLNYVAEGLDSAHYEGWNDELLLLNKLLDMRKLTIMSWRNPDSGIFNWKFPDCFWKLVTGNRRLELLTVVGFELENPARERFQSVMQQQGIGLEVISNLGFEFGEYFGLRFSDNIVYKKSAFGRW